MSARTDTSRTGPARAGLVTRHPTLLGVYPGGEDTPQLVVTCPVLAGETAERLLPGATPAGRAGRFALARYDGWLLGSAALPCRGDVEAAARALYRDLLRSLGGHVLVRVWNYLPAINQTSPGGLENYRAFCRARSLAFEEHFGAAFPRHVPAASAVGCDGDDLAVIFAAHAGSASHVENPQQTPAYHYPDEYGPRAPTFARASLVELGGGRRAAFISGTAAIRGHASVAPGETAPQLECTLANLREISLACGLGPDLAADRAGPRQFKVYLRHAADLARVRTRLEAALLRPADRVTYLRADICRAELMVEIEATLPEVAPA